MRLDNINRDIIIIRGFSLPAGKLAFKAGDRAPWINNVPPFKIIFKISKDEFQKFNLRA